MKHIASIIWCLLLFGCAHDGANSREKSSALALAPRLQALLDRAEPEIKAVKHLPSLPEKGLSDSELTEFRAKLASLKFPLRAGTVLSLLPYEMIPYRRMDSDAFGAPDGYVGGTGTWYALSPRYVLHLDQSQYFARADQMVTVDIGAKIMTTKEAEKSSRIFRGEEMHAEYWPNKRIEPMTRSAVRLRFQSNATGALLVMAHPDRSLRHEAAFDTA